MTGEVSSFALGTFSAESAAPFAGMVLQDSVVALDAFGVGGTMLAILDNWDDSLPVLKSAAQRWHNGDAGLRDAARRVSALHVHPPVAPRQIFGIGANYRQHVIELVMADPSMRSEEYERLPDEAARRAAVERMMDERGASALPYCFTKLPSSVAGARDALELPAISQKVDWECELAVVIGRAARHVAARDARSYIAGYAVANDVTARDLVFRRDVKSLGTDWLSAKSQPGFTPLGPYIVPADFVDAGNLQIRLSVNGRVMQDENTRDMLIPIDRQIEYLSARVKLLPGDIICTGSPAGNGSHHGVFLRDGDMMVGEITGLGEQRVPCVAAPGR